MHMHGLSLSARHLPCSIGVLGIPIWCVCGELSFSMLMAQAVMALMAGVRVSLDLEQRQDGGVARPNDNTYSIL